ncbi:hypothetical protein FOMPIDRAFT_1109836 [Fomitopsis schrenkii]|uniref:Uncharacterized protein n=1 Tax=Fomitopsis schrenkii TaxID=2126942 RepID=S8ET90_FOMSC|nr:hypothetical protein FOMPIDRAFT_1109836 [Fomitopsis schrenkii]
MFPLAIVLVSLTLSLLIQPWPRPALAAATIVTIDDEYGDSLTGALPVYEGAWKFGPDCSDCLLQPSPADAYRSGWHDTTTSTQYAQQTVTLTFNGTAISVYCIVPNYSASANTFVNISFSLDGNPATTYDSNSTDTVPAFRYNVTVYSVAGLASGEHTLVMAPLQDPSSSVVLFDWAEYT